MGTLYFRELFKESDDDTHPTTHYDSISFSVSNHSYNTVDEGSPHTPPPVESISDISLQEIELPIVKLKSGKLPRNDHITT